MVVPLGTRNSVPGLMALKLADVRQLTYWTPEATTAQAQSANTRSRSALQQQLHSADKQTICGSLQCLIAFYGVPAAETVSSKLLMPLGIPRFTLLGFGI